MSESIADKLRLLPRVEPQSYDRSLGYHVLKMRFVPTINPQHNLHIHDGSTSIIGLDWGCVDAPNLEELPKSLREMWLEGTWRDEWTDRDTKRLDKLCRWELENKLSVYGRQELSELRERLKSIRERETLRERQRFAEKLAPRSPQSPANATSRALTPPPNGAGD